MTNASAAKGYRAGGAGGIYSVRNLAALVLVGGLAGLGYAVMRASQRVAAEKEMGREMYIDETGRTFERRLGRVGDAAKVKSPWGTRAFPAERCYWTREGGVKSEATVVMLKSYVEGPGARTYCPDCGREVVAGNPVPYRDEAGRVVPEPPPMKADGGSEGKP